MLIAGPLGYTPPPMLRPLLVLGVAAFLAWCAPASADVASSPDSVYLVGEFVDPVCMYQHGMQGRAQRACAMVRGRVDQGMAFLDIRQRRLYTVIGFTHEEDPRERFLALLGDTVAIRAREWQAAGSSAIAVNAVYPVGLQPRASYSPWPWNWEWSVLAGCGLLALLHLAALGPWRRRLGGPARFEAGRALLFLSGLAVVVVSLNGPIHDLSDLYLFSTHMVHNLFLAELFPPLVILGIPSWLMARMLRPAPIAAGWRFLARLPMGFALYTVVLFLWHVPTLYDLMMRAHGFHVLMHLMVMATSVLMWWPILGTDPGMKRLSPPAAMLYVLALSTPMMVVAAILTFADHPLYEWYALAPRIGELTALDDQRLGGLLMWVPGTFIYWGVVSAIFLRWASRESKREQRPVIPEMAT